MKDDIPSALRSSSDATANSAGANKSDAGNGISYKIIGEEMQYIEIEVPPSGAVVGDGERMVYYDKGIDMKVRMSGGDTGKKVSFIKKILKLGASVMSGEKLFMMTFSNATTETHKVSFATPSPGKIIEINLKEFGGRILCQKESFLCAGKGVKVTLASQREISGSYGNSGLVFNKLEGAGIVFLYMAGGAIKKTLRRSESILAATGTVSAFEPSVNCRVKTLHNIDMMGGAYKLSQISGPGNVWLQTMPFNILKDNIANHTKKKFKIKDDNKTLFDIINGDK